MGLVLPYEGCFIPASKIDTTQKKGINCNTFAMETGLRARFKKGSSSNN